MAIIDNFDATHVRPIHKRVGAIRVTALQMGVVSAILAVAAEAFFAVRPPDTYGICMACHARDLMNWIINAVLGTQLTVAPVSLIFPVLTTIGVLIGGLVAAKLSGEFRWRTTENPVKTFVYGLFVMNFALLAAGCSFRLLLRAAAGETLGLFGLGGMVIGVVLGTVWLRWRATQ